MYEKSIRLTQLVTIRDMLRRGWTLGNLRQDGEFVYFESDDHQYRMNPNGDISVKRYELTMTREEIRIPREV